MIVKAHEHEFQPVIAIRILAVLAAILLVGAFTLATLLPPDLPLSAALAMLQDGLPSRIQAWAQAQLPAWTWLHLAVPLLTRPVWLMPAAVGVVAAGASATLASSSTASRSRRRS
jgi:hypothetical protein